MQIARPAYYGQTHLYRLEIRIETFDSLCELVCFV